MGQGIYKYDIVAGGNWCPLNPGAPAPGGCPPAGATGLPNPTIAAESFNHVELEFAPSDPNIIYAMFGKSANITLANATPMLYKSTDGGMTWTQITFTAPYNFGMLTYS